MVGKDDDALVVNLGVAARDDDLLHPAAVLLAKVQANHAVTQRADLWRVSGPHAQLARVGDQDEARDGSLIEEPVRADELTIELGHVSS